MPAKTIVTVVVLHTTVNRTLTKIVTVLTTNCTQMVRNYQKKEVRNKWKEDDMKAAIEAVTSTQMTLSGAAKYFDVPRETLRRRVTGKVRVNARAG